MVAQYTVIDNQVYYEHHYTGCTLLTGADAPTFTALLDPVVTGYFAGWHFAAKDQATVWFMNRPVIGADPATFTYYWGGQCHWGIDHQHIYCFYVGRKPSYKPSFRHSLVKQRKYLTFAKFCQIANLN